MADARPRWPGRILGAIIGGGGAFAALQVAPWEPTLPIAIAISAGAAVAGLWFGPRVWRAVIELA